MMANLARLTLNLANQWGSLLANSHELRSDTSRMQQSLFELTRAFVESVEAQDFKQLGHAQRVTNYAMALGTGQKLSRPQLLSFTTQLCFMILAS